MNIPKTLTEFCGMPPDSFGKYLDEQKLDIICKTVYGSKLYRMDGPESDLDIRGIFTPKKSECYLGKIKDTVDGVGDVQFFSVQKFLRLAAEGQSVAIEILYSDQVFEESYLWRRLIKHRDKFLSKKMKNFCGYAKAQSIKYSSRADRLNDINALRDLIIKWINNTSAPILGCDHFDAKLSVIWDILPEGINYKKSTNQFNRSKDNRVYIICGRELQIHCTVKHLLEFTNMLRDEYGERVKKAAAQHVDFKALSHAYRVTYQAQELIKERTLTFPAKEIEFLRDIKFGKLDLIKDGLDAKLEDLIQETDELMARSDLPDEVDWAFCEEFILGCYL